MIAVWLFLAVPWVCLRFVIVVFPDHTHLLFSSFAVTFQRKRELVVLLLLSYEYLVTVYVLWLFFKVSWVGLQCKILVFPDHTHLLFEKRANSHCMSFSSFVLPFFLLLLISARIYCN